MASPAATVPVGRELAELSRFGYTMLGLEANPLAERLVAGNGGTVVAPELHIWRLSSGAAQRLIPRLRALGAIRYAEPDRPVLRQS
ncbi:MAG: hypothetical protein H0V79_07140, partial [Actinobacteria bacterium]|nr:hypothetical protein [Actinomycetota bacterium]